MIVEYEDSRYSRHTLVERRHLEDFINANCDGSISYDNRKLLIGLIEALAKKNLITPDELTNILPARNFDRILSFEQEG